MEQVELVNELVAEGLNDCEISRRTGIPRRTILGWRHGRAPKPRQDLRCSVCSHGVFEGPEDSYAYLLGMYLGDGCISAAPRTHVLRITLDGAYPAIVTECASSMAAVCPPKRARVDKTRSRAVTVVMCWKHWPCLFPQHGPGRKHERSIYLSAWQEELVARNHESLIRGLVHSDGCRVVANDRGVASLRYHFDNLSEDIKRIYCRSLDALGIHWTRPSYKDIAVYRKADTARLDEFVGPKE